MTQPKPADSSLLFSLLTVAVPILAPVVAPVAAQANPGTIPTFCKPSLLNDAPQVQGRATKILFPDGRVITLVGHESSNAKMLELSEIVLSQKLSKMNDADFAKLISSTQQEVATPSKSMALNTNRKAMATAIRMQTGLDAGEAIDKNSGLDITNTSAKTHAVQDYLYLQDVFAKPIVHGRVEFIGLEDGSTTWPAQKVPLMITQQNLVRQMTERRKQGKIKITDQEFGEMLVAATGGNLYAYIRDPRLESIAPLVPIDSNLEASDLDGQRQKIAAIWASVPSLQTMTPHQTGVLALIKQLEFDAMNANINSVNELEKRLAALKGEAGSLIGAGFDQLANVYRDIVRVQLASETETARKLVDRFQSGIHFVSLSHYGPMTRSLQKLCEAELTESRPTLQPVSR